MGEIIPRWEWRTFGSDFKGADQKIMDLTEENVRATAKASDVVFIQVPSGDVAKWGGIVMKILYFLAALIGGFLPISGYYMWWKRQSSKSRAKLV